MTNAEALAKVCEALNVETTGSETNAVLIALIAAALNTDRTNNKAALEDVCEALGAEPSGDETYAQLLALIAQSIPGVIPEPSPQPLILHVNEVTWDDGVANFGESELTERPTRKEITDASNLILHVSLGDVDETIVIIQGVSGRLSDDMSEFVQMFGTTTAIGTYRAYNAIVTFEYNSDGTLHQVQGSIRDVYM